MQAFAFTNTQRGKREREREREREKEREQGRTCRDQQRDTKTIGSVVIRSMFGVRMHAPYLGGVRAL